jgi:hypothetical protein
MFESIIVYAEVQLQSGRIQSILVMVRVLGKKHEQSVQSRFGEKLANSISRPNSNLCRREAVHHHSHHWACR